MTIKTQVNEILGFGKKTLNLPKVVQRLTKLKHATEKLRRGWKKFLDCNPSAEQAAIVMFELFPHYFPDEVSNEELVQQFPTIEAVDKMFDALASKNGSGMEKDRLARMRAGRHGDPYDDEPLHEACITPPVNLMLTIGANQLEAKSQSMQDKIRAILAAED